MILPALVTVGHGDVRASNHLHNNCCSRVSAARSAGARARTTACTWLVRASDSDQCCAGRDYFWHQPPLGLTFFGRIAVRPGSPPQSPVAGIYRLACRHILFLLVAPLASCPWLLGDLPPGPPFAHAN